MSTDAVKSKQNAPQKSTPKNNQPTKKKSVSSVTQKSTKLLTSTYSSLIGEASSKSNKKYVLDNSELGFISQEPMVQPRNNKSSKTASIINNIHGNSKKTNVNNLNRTNGVVSTKNTSQSKDIQKRQHVKVDSLINEELRPSTATLSKGRIVNSNIAGPNIPLDKEDSISYEDDFEAYESDFESDSDIEEATRVPSPPVKLVESVECQLDSGTYDLPDPKIKISSVAKNKIVEKLEMGINIPNTLLLDEGFESIPTTLESKPPSTVSRSNSFRRTATTKSSVKNRRSNAILSLIHLDTYTFTLLDLHSVPYDEFMQQFGARNTVQTYCQTEMQSNCDEEIQTDSIDYQTKWTQIPIRITKLPPESVPSFEHDTEYYRSNYFGVGTDSIQTIKSDPKLNTNRLSQFMSNSGNLILNLLTAGTYQRHISKFKPDTNCIKIRTQKLERMKKHTIIDVFFTYFSTSKTLRVITVHGKYKLQSLICIWLFSHQMETPEKILTVFGKISCCNSGWDFIFAGLDDGTITTWNQSRVNESLIYTEINQGHKSKVIKLIPLISSGNCLETSFNASALKYVISLDEDGTLIRWHLNPKMGTLDKLITLSLSAIHPKLENSFQCTDLAISCCQSYLYVTTNAGWILHLRSTLFHHPGTDLIRKFHSYSHRQPVFCVESCPFAAQFFTCGTSDGNVAIYAHNFEYHQRPLLVFNSAFSSTSTSHHQSTEWNAQIRRIQWSAIHPFSFYVQNGASVIEIWNLKKSDIQPEACITLKKKEIVALKLLSNGPTTTINNGSVSCLAVASKCGTVYLYQWDRPLDGQDLEELYKNDVQHFFSYINSYIYK